MLLWRVLFSLKHYFLHFCLTVTYCNLKTTEMESYIVLKMIEIKGKIWTTTASQRTHLAQIVLHLQTTNGNCNWWIVIIFLCTARGC